MKLNNHGWGLMAFLILSFVILMVIFLVAGEITNMSELYWKTIRKRSTLLIFEESLCKVKIDNKDSGR